MIELNQGGTTTCIDSSYNINYNGTALTDIWVCDTTNATCVKVWNKQSPVPVTITKKFWGGKLNSQLCGSGNGHTCVWETSTLTASHCACFGIAYDSDNNCSCVTFVVYGQGNTNYRCSGNYTITIDNTGNTTSTTYTFKQTGSECNLGVCACFKDTDKCQYAFTQVYSCGNNRTCTYSCSITVPGGCCCVFEMPTYQYQNCSIINGTAMNCDDDEISCIPECWNVCYVCISEYNNLGITVSRDGSTVASCSYFGHMWNRIGASSPSSCTVSFCA